MSTPRALVLGLVMAGCSAPIALEADAGHPASPSVSASASATAFALEVGALPPVPQPNLPTALRSGEMPHREMSHGEDHSFADAPTTTALERVLDAYLAVQTALATDRLSPDDARDLEDAFGTWEQTPPDDDPHLWHRQSEASSRVRTALRDLAAASDLEAARQAFGIASAALVPFVEAANPDLDLERHTCGMAPGVPEGGIWLQRPGAIMNPYFGTAMQMCSRGAVPVSHVPAAMEPMDHTMIHGDHE